MDSALSPSSNSLCITHWENYRSQTLPTDSTDEPKIAARVTETAGRVRLAFAAACPEADLFRGLANALIPQGP
jgi:hypothetical protein